MNDRFEISLLLDYYMELLTEKQQDIMNMYYNDDFSLAEIAEINNTSRQAIHDLIKRCDKMLISYEEKLNLLEKSNIRKTKKNEIVEKLTNEYMLSKELVDGIDEILEEIINS
ncbi:putative DNA-binding protein [Clostridium sp. C8-1-8]|uniref:putative DNA-binding protein n=1 Tax=Clostridium sp. C8-1-8 TaxID=2698831 RepID=UPI00136920E6|nr:putative DNA-binding protein [Clostridium sp. C8-1-8]